MKKLLAVAMLLAGCQYQEVCYAEEIVCFGTNITCNADCVTACVADFDGGVYLTSNLGCEPTCWVNDQYRKPRCEYVE